jgi:hypothetical protein
VGGSAFDGAAHAVEDAFLQQEEDHDDRDQ